MIEDGVEGAVKLPSSFDGLPPRTGVTLWLPPEIRPGGDLLVKSFYSPLKIFRR